MKKYELTGKIYGKLVVISFDHKGNYGHSYWLCKCECGGTKIVRGSNLTSGITTSCGCYQLETQRTNGIKHGDYNTKLYKEWHGIKCRCNVKSSGNYDLYGGRGISICEDWLDYDNFKKWSLSNGYEEGLSIDRINVEGNYEPSNCRWITMKDQQRNKRNSRIITYNDVTKHIFEWCEELELNKNTIASRYQKGLRGDNLFKK